MAQTLGWFDPEIRSWAWFDPELSEQPLLDMDQVNGVSPFRDRKWVKPSWFDAQIRPSAWFDPEMSSLGYFDRTLPSAAPAITLALSSNIPSVTADIPSGANTTGQLSVPNSHTFGTGRIQDDENPTDPLNLAINNYREDEWAMKLTSDAPVGTIYEFRLVLDSGVVLNTYTVTPTITVAAPTGGGATLFRSGILASSIIAGVGL